LKDGRLKGRVALVTGAAQGIGAAVSLGLASEGALVLVTDRDGNAAEATAARIAAQFGVDACAAVKLDVTAEDDWTNAIAACRSRFGALNILVNNAGVMKVGSIADIDLADWRLSMAINADGPFLGCKHALPLMCESQPGSIVNIASISALVASERLVAYNASKAALWMLTKSVALHCARRGWNIRCNSIHPSFVRTALLDGFIGEREPDEVLGKLSRQIPTGRIAEVEDVVAAVIYLASDDSAMMTASELKLDGGLSAM